MNPSNLPVVIYLFPILSTFAFTSFVIDLKEASEASSVLSLRVAKQLSAHFRLVEINDRIYYQPQGQRRAICITKGWKLQVVLMITTVADPTPQVYGINHVAEVGGLFFTFNTEGELEADWPFDNFQ